LLNPKLSYRARAPRSSSPVPSQHVVGAFGAGQLDRRVEQRAADPVAPALRHDVELGQVGLQARGRDRRAQAHDREPLRRVPAEQDVILAAADQ